MAVAMGAWLGWSGGKATVDEVRRMRSQDCECVVTMGIEIPHRNDKVWGRREGAESGLTIFHERWGSDQEVD